ncbi:MAG: CHASE2 domain-containing protein [Verrucomicrobium sp.]|nr:CHASE2 domain-containing protein [Verrucomicrobium sp.]
MEDTPAEHLPPPLPRRFALKRDRLAGVLGLVWAVLVALLYACGLFDGLEDKVRDWEQTVLPSRAGSDDFAFVSIDRVPTDRPWPWARLEYALLLRALVPVSPQSVVFEIPMHDRSPRTDAFDQSFARQVGRFEPQRIVFAASAIQAEAGAPQGGTLPGPALRVRGGAAPRLPLFSAAWGPVEAFSDRSAVGIANFSCAPDETLRRLPLVFAVEKEKGKDVQVLPSLVLSAAAARLDADLSQSELVPGRAVVLRDKAGRKLRRIPVDSEGRLLLRWRRPGVPPLRVAYDDFLLYADQMERGVPARVDLRRLARRQVWIGLADPAVSPLRRTAVGDLPAAAAGLAAAGQIERGDFLLPLPRWAAIFLFLATGTLLAYAMELLAPSRALTMVLGLAALLGALGLGAFWLSGLCLPLGALGVLLCGTFVGSRAARLWEVDPPHHRPVEIAALEEENAPSDA